jgi:hypothetical protein
MKYWEIFADNLKKAGWSWAVSQRLIPTGEQSLSLMHIPATESGSLCVRMKSRPLLLNCNRRLLPGWPSRDRL